MVKRTPEELEIKKSTMRLDRQHDQLEVWRLVNLLLDADMVTRSPWIEIVQVDTQYWNVIVIDRTEIAPDDMAMLWGFCAHEGARLALKEVHLGGQGAVSRLVIWPKHADG